jgi:hypothetical protein
MTECLDLVMRNRGENERRKEQFFCFTKTREISATEERALTRGERERGEQLPPGREDRREEETSREENRAEMEQAVAWFACEYALDSSSVARTGEVSLAAREGKLLFRQADRKTQTERNSNNSPQVRDESLVLPVCAKLLLLVWHREEKQGDRKVEELALSSVEAIKQEADVVSLRLTSGGEAKLRLRDLSFLTQLAREMARGGEARERVPDKEKPHSRFPTLGFAGFKSCEVTSPTEVSWQGENYVVFAIRSRVLMTQGLANNNNTSEEREWIVYHRYSDFEKFDQKLRNLVNDHLDSNLILLPILPQKPWLPQSNREFVESRSRKLDRYMKSVCGNAELTKRVQYLDVILSFVSTGEGASNSGAAGKTISANASLLGKTVLAANHGLSKLLDSRTPPAPEEDYAYISSLVKKQGLGNLKPILFCFSFLRLQIRNSHWKVRVLEQIGGGHFRNNIERQIVAGQPFIFCHLFRLFRSGSN